MATLRIARSTVSIVDQLPNRPGRWPGVAENGDSPFVPPRSGIYNQTMPTAIDDLPLKQKVQRVIDLIRPAIQADGGDVELVDVLPDGTVQIRFHGACHGCPSSKMTLQYGLERNIREKIPQVSSVVAVV